LTAPRRVLFVGGNFQRKGLLVLLRAAPAIAAQVPDVRFTVIGKSYYTRGARRLADQLGVSDRFDFVGRVSYQTLAGYYAEATVLTMPSLMEAFGIPYLEGMSCGLPVVATDCRGPDEYLRNGDNALVVTPGDPEALGVALIRALTDTGLRDRLRQGGFKTAREFTPEKMAAETMAVYHDAVQSSLST
jgi:glycosyltransferase involved in cell wall biosynthesis